MGAIEIHELHVRYGETSDSEVSLPVTAYVPEITGRAKRFPTVIFAHDLGGNREEGDVYAREFAQHGYAACCLDFFGRLNSAGGGLSQGVTLFSQEEDFEAAYEALTEEPWMDANNVFFMGHGTGALVAALAAGRKSGKVKGLMLLAPAFSLPDVTMGIAPLPDDIPYEADVFGVRVGRGFIDTLRGFDAFGAAASYEGPVLIIHGTADLVVPSAYSVQAAREFKHANVELIGDAGHAFGGGALKYAIRILIDFLDEECDLADESGLGGDLNFKGGGMFG